MENSKKILIVEDDKYIAELERDYLEANGYEIDIVMNGRDGAKAALENDYALILLDIMLPDMDGFEICRKIREKKDIPIFFVSAKTEDIDKIRGFGIGADDYITKPFNPSELVARINGRIMRYNNLKKSDVMEVDESIIKVQDLKIDKTSRRVEVRGKTVVLTNKEFELLSFLATNPNKVFSKMELFNKIWGLDSIGETSTVTVHVNRLREKIETNSNAPEYIETVWGIGYRFRDPSALN